MVQELGSFHLYGRPGCSSWPLALAQVQLFRALRNEAIDGDLPLFLLKIKMLKYFEKEKQMPGKGAPIA